MTAADKTTAPAVDPREAGTQLRPGLWHTINERYPGSMIRKESFVPQAHMVRPLQQARISLVSSCGAHRKADAPLDVCHPFGDFRFLRVPSTSRHDDLIIHQLKYPHDDADLDINVIFPIERLQELHEEGRIGSLTGNFFSFIGYNMDPARFEETVARGIAEAVVQEEKADCALLAPA
ncbi:MAG TPA: glycine/sarcosine/betaine reductase selenoprotein B family protein [Candidatus Acidoferrum sp.]|nr:glycine/sarcosine/betaine reductase selenoprotein B family protein [Candidatus Acidoferrum sp.]